MPCFLYAGLYPFRPPPVRWSWRVDGRRCLWITPRFRVSLWALARGSRQQNQASIRRPLPLLVGRANKVQGGRHDHLPLPPTLLMPVRRFGAPAARPRIRTSLVREMGGTGRVAGIAQNVGPAASGGCHAGWQTMAGRAQSRPKSSRVRMCLPASMSRTGMAG